MNLPVERISSIELRRRRRGRAGLLAADVDRAVGRDADALGVVEPERERLQRLGGTIAGTAFFRGMSEPRSVTLLPKS